MSNCHIGNVDVHRLRIAISNIPEQAVPRVNMTDDGALEIMTLSMVNAE